MIVAYGESVRCQLTPPTAHPRSRRLPSFEFDQNRAQPFDTAWGLEYSLGSRIVR